MADVEFETLKSEEISFGNNNFLEIARKVAKGEDGETEFLQIARGFFAPDGSKRYKKSIAVPDNPELKDFIVEKIKEI
jgi:hypothetical protein